MAKKRKIDLNPDPYAGRSQRKNRQFKRKVALPSEVIALMDEGKRLLAKRELARRRLHDFIRYTYPGYKVADHNILICHYVDKWVAGEIKRLMIFTPPRHGKSEIVSRRLPAYIMGRFPGAQIILGSYGQDLANDMSRDTKDIVRSEKYRHLFEDAVIARDRDSVDDWAMVPTADGPEASRYKCAGIGGPITGRGFTHGIIDDPVKDRKDAESLTVSEMTWNWWTSTFYTRAQPDAGILIVQTRWSDNDLSGRLIASMMEDPLNDQWVILDLPALSLGVKGPWDKNDPMSHSDLLGRIEGQPLWSSAYNKKQLESIKVNIGRYDWEALYQQRPRPSGGDKIQADWFQTIANFSPINPPSGWVRFWDLAISSKTSADFTCSYRMCIGEDGYIYVADEVRGQWLWPEARHIIKETCEREEKLGVYIGIEEAGQQKGFINDLQTMPELARFTIQGIPVDRDKLTRGLPWISRAQQGLVRLVQGPWNRPCVEELIRFTGKDDIRDDREDSIAGGYNMLASEAIGFSVEDLEPQPRQSTGEPTTKEIKKALEEKGFAPDAIQRVIDNMNIRPTEDIMQDERVWQ